MSSSIPFFRSVLQNTTEQSNDLRGLLELGVPSWLDVCAVYNV